MQEIVVGKQRLSVGQSIGKGGEGEVFRLNGRPDQAVKIYSSDLRSKREEKIRAMVLQGLAAKTNLVAYPFEVAFDRRGQFLGFLMRLVTDYRPLHELYSPKSRLQNFPKADYRFVLRAALNVAKAIGSVHDTGCVVGDLNHSGVLVSEHATVALIDADSFQFRLGSKTYPCLVGVPDFTPPELHGRNLANVERTFEHDSFGLAVAIFHLLFMGRHPYAGRYNGPDLSIDEAISQNRFAFSLLRKAETLTAPPPGALELELFPIRLQGAFEDAFGLDPTSRPSARQWVKDLTALEASLSRCSRVKTHYYPTSASRCVWCELAGNSGLDMFPDGSSISVLSYTPAKSTDQAIREIMAFRVPNATALLPQPTVQPKGDSAALKEAKSAVNSRNLLGVLAIGGAILMFIVAPQFWFAWVGAGIWGITRFRGNAIDPAPLRVAIQEADERIQRELDGLVKRAGLEEALGLHGELETTIAAYNSVDGELASELQRQKANREARHLSAFLDRFYVRSAHITGIGIAKTTTLISFGIETAADVTQASVMRVPGFGNVMTGKLMQWRHTCAAQFRYDPTPTRQDIADETAVRNKLAVKKAGLEKKIIAGHRTLKSAQAALATLGFRATQDGRLLQAINDRAKTVQDLTLIGASVPPAQFSLSVTPSYRSQTSPAGSPTVVVPPVTSGGVPSCPVCGTRMVRRTARRGYRAGHQFWGCARYPRCTGTRN